MNGSLFISMNFYAYRTPICIDGKEDTIVWMLC